MIRVTALQRDELLHKLQIIGDEPELRADYGVTEDEVDALMTRVQTGEFELSPSEAEMLLGEIENLLDIAYANHESAVPEERASIRGYISSILALERKVQSCSGA